MKKESSKVLDIFCVILLIAIVILGALYGVRSFNYYSLNEDIRNLTQISDCIYSEVEVSEEELAPNVWCYGLGFKYEIERGPIALQNYDKNKCAPGISIDLKNSDIKIDIGFRPRSSVWKTGMSLSNSEGTLDEFYRGEAKAVFYHLMPNMPRYKVGDKIGQIKLGFTVPIEFSWNDEINENTERGEGGFGSTGKS